MRNRILIIISGLLYFYSLTGQDKIYLFSYFVDNGQDGLHLAASEDGYYWTSLKGGKSFLKPTAGMDRLMRDPCIITGPDGTFHLVWTVSWNERGIGYASSKDLINWSEQRFLPVMEHEPTARNCWAPELYFDDQTGLYLIYWATTIPGRFPETSASGDNDYNHRIYYTTTKEFQSFSPTKLLFDQGFNVIDAVIFPDSLSVYMILKNETRYPPEKNLRIARSSELTSPYSPASENISGKEWVEGPTVIKIDQYWIVYFDQYINHRMGAIRTKDLVTWENISDKVTFPEGCRHGTVFSISKGQFTRLQNAIADQ